VNTSPTLEARERVAQLVLELFCLEFYDWGLVQTDPNYGNFLVDPETLRLGVLDFGATLRYNKKFRSEYGDLVRTIQTSDPQRIVARFIDSGDLDPRESEETKLSFANLMILSAEPFRADLQPFRFRDADYARRSREAGQKFVQSLKYSAPPRRILFLHRKLGGIFNLMKKLDVAIDVTPFLDRLTKRS
jgi:aarF domain-containing kinase